VSYGVVNKHLEGRLFLVGSEPTIADFSLSGYLFYPVEESGYGYPSRYPSIAAWIERLKAVPGWAPPYEVLPGARIAPRW
jgi:glutathione S-transferase